MPFLIATVDGRNPTPADRWFIPLFIGFQPSKVVQDFFHQQYVTNYQMVISPNSSYPINQGYTVGGHWDDPTSWTSFTGTIVKRNQQTYLVGGLEHD